MIFLITYQIRNGERQYTVYHTTNAPNKNEAEQRAIKYISNFYLGGTELDGTESTRFWKEDETEYIELVDVERVTAEQLVNLLSIDPRGTKQKSSFPSF